MILIVSLIGGALLWNFTISEASAHHFMDGGVPFLWYEGFLSGLAHPIIGLDHLLFVIACGLAGFGAGHPRLLPALFIGGTLIGTGMHVMALDIIFSEEWIAASLLSIGFVFASKRTMPLALWVTFCLVAGLVHGYAYGETIVGAEYQTLLSYMMGFALIQYAVAYGSGRFLWRHLLHHDGGSRLVPIGGALCLMGLLLLI